jgi:hypothetical protein
MCLGHLVVLLDLGLAFLAGLFVRLWRFNFPWHVLLVAIHDLIVVLARILTHAFPLLWKIVQFFHYVFLRCFVVEELQSLRIVFMIVDLHNPIFTLNIFWVLSLLNNILLMQLFDLHVRTLLRLCLCWSRPLGVWNSLRDDHLGLLLWPFLGLLHKSRDTIASTIWGGEILSTWERIGVSSSFTEVLLFPCRLEGLVGPDSMLMTHNLLLLRIRLISEISFNFLTNFNDLASC